MQHDLFSFPTDNTRRDSNEKPPTPSAPIENPISMDTDPHSLSFFDPLAPARINPSNRQQYHHRPLINSAIQRQPGDDDDEVFARQQQELLYNNDDPSLVASGVDNSRLLDDDAAYALQLQQEEYTRDSIAPSFANRNAQRRQRNDVFPPFPVFDPNNPTVDPDQAMAAYLQHRENQAMQRPRRPPFLSSQRRPPNQSLPNGDSIEVLPYPSFYDEPVPRSQPNDDDEDDDSEDDANVLGGATARSRNNAGLFLQMLAQHNQPFPVDPHFFFRGMRRRGGPGNRNLQETEDDFGPEDYERLLQLDETIAKKKLSKNQINTIPTENFTRTLNTNDEQNTCSICYEIFEDNQILRRLPCTHRFHQECTDRWLQENNVCPICRVPPVNDPPQASSGHRQHRPARPPHNRYTNNGPRSTNPHNRPHNYQGRRGGGGGGASSNSSQS